MARSTKLILAVGILVAATGYLAYEGAAGSWQYYLTPDECLRAGQSLSGVRVRVAGKVHGGSLRIAANRTQAAFALEGTAGLLPVESAGTVPDNLAENMDVVVEGRWEAPGVLRGDRLLTKCASKYEAQSRPGTDDVPPGGGDELR